MYKNCTIVYQEYFQKYSRVFAVYHKLAVESGYIVLMSEIRLEDKSFNRIMNGMRTSERDDIQSAEMDDHLDSLKYHKALAKTAFTKDKNQVFHLIEMTMSMNDTENE